MLINQEFDTEFFMRNSHAAMHGLSGTTFIGGIASGHDHPTPLIFDAATTVSTAGTIG